MRISEESGYRLSERLACLDLPPKQDFDVTDAFTLMQAMVNGASKKGQYYAAPGLLCHLFYWQTPMPSRESIHLWLGELVSWGEIEVAPLALNCYGNSWQDVFTILNKQRFRRWRNRDYIPHSVRESVYARDGYACVHCGATEHLSIDHIIPWSKGGADDESNYQTLCRSCNSKKGANVHGLVQS